MAAALQEALVAAHVGTTSRYRLGVALATVWAAVTWLLGRWYNARIDQPLTTRIIAKTKTT